MTGAELRILRKTHGLTQRALALLLGYTPNYIARLERGDIERGATLKISQRLEKLILLILPKKSSKKA